MIFSMRKKYVFMLLNVEMVSSMKTSSGSKIYRPCFVVVVVVAAAALYQLCYLSKFPVPKSVQSHHAAIFLSLKVHKCMCTCRVHKSRCVGIRLLERCQHL